MYLQGLRSLGQDGADAVIPLGTSYDPAQQASQDALAAEISNALSTGSGSIPVPSVQAPTSTVDWTKLAGTALTVWGTYAGQKLQADTTVKTAPYRVYVPGTGYVYPGTAAPVVGSALPVSGSALLILLALGAAAFIFLKD